MGSRILGINGSRIGTRGPATFIGAGRTGLRTASKAHPSSTSCAGCARVSPARARASPTRGRTLLSRAPSYVRRSEVGVEGTEGRHAGGDTEHRPGSVAVQLGARSRGAFASRSSRAGGVSRRRTWRSPLEQTFLSGPEIFPRPRAAREGLQHRRTGGHRGCVPAATEVTDPATGGSARRRSIPVGAPIAAVQRFLGAENDAPESPVRATVRNAPAARRLPDRPCADSGRRSSTPWPLRCA